MIKRAERNAPDSTAKYVYCVIPCPTERKSFGGLGFDAGEVYTLDYKDLAPVVSDVTYRDYAANEEEVVVHRNVVEQIMLEHSVIPVAFGMAFKTRKLLQIAMSAGYLAMQKAQQVVDGKVELGVKVLSSQGSGADGVCQERRMQLGFSPTPSGCIRRLEEAQALQRSPGAQCSLFGRQIQS